MARDSRRNHTSPLVGEAVRQFVVDAATEKIAEKANAAAAKQSAKIVAATTRHAATLERLAAHLGTLDVWTRSSTGSRKPRFTRDDIAATAIKIADAEGFDAVSMRRLALELDAGTMTLYHYVRTKDELLTLVVDAFLGEVVVPSGVPLPDDWRQAITLIATRSRDALRRHPWILDIADDPNIGPNAMRHFDQSWQAVRSFGTDLETKLDLITAVDEYVFGFCTLERNNLSGGNDDADMVDYINSLLNSDHYPALSALVGDVGLDNVWSLIHAHARGTRRFDRNLVRLLDGFEAAARAGPSTPLGL